jgi:hypothetical protein
MKSGLLLLALPLFLLSCQEPTKPNTQKDTTPKLENLDWLLGSWVRLNDDEGRQTFEIWEKETNQEFRGNGYTMSGEDTIFKEDMRILFKEENVNLEVSGVNQDPTYFKFIGQETNAFACENPANEFPQRIEYIYQNDTIFATIMGGANSIVFVFVRN